MRHQPNRRREKKVTRENVLENASEPPTLLTPKALFGVVVKTIGLCIFIYGCYTITYGICGVILGLYPTLHGIGAYIIWAVIYIGFGIILMRTKWIANLAYGRD